MISSEFILLCMLFVDLVGLFKKKKQLKMFSIVEVKTLFGKKNRKISLNIWKIGNGPNLRKKIGMIPIKSV